MLIGCDQGVEVDYTFEGEIVSAPSAHADYIIDTGDGERFEPIELDERYRKAGIRVRVKAVEESVPTVMMVGPVIRIVDIEEI